MGLLFAHCSNLSAARRLLIWYCLFTGDSFFLAEKCPEPITARGESPTFYDFPDILSVVTANVKIFFLINQSLGIQFRLDRRVRRVRFGQKAHRCRKILIPPDWKSWVPLPR